MNECGGAGSGGGLSKPGARQLTELLICGSFKLHGWNCYPLLHVSFLRKLESALVLLLMVPYFSLGEYMIKCGYYKQVRTKLRNTPAHTVPHINGNSTFHPAYSSRPVFIEYSQSNSIRTERYCLEAPIWIVHANQSTHRHIRAMPTLPRAFYASSLYRFFKGLSSNLYPSN